MKKLKDFFYDKNDIIIVLIIVAVAALLIFNRIDAIMDYPAKYAEENAATETKATVTITEPSTEAETTESTGEVEETAADEEETESE